MSSRHALLLRREPGRRVEDLWQLHRRRREQTRRPTSSPPRAAASTRCATPEPSPPSTSSARCAWAATAPLSVERTTWANGGRGARRRSAQQAGDAGALVPPGLRHPGARAHAVLGLLAQHLQALHRRRRLGDRRPVHAPRLRRHGRVESGDTSKPYRHVRCSRPASPSTSAWGRLRPDRPPPPAGRAARAGARRAESVRRLGRWGRRFDDATLRADERIYVDTWGLKASTTDVRAFFDVTRKLRIGPHARFHVQGPVDFWRRAYVATPNSSGFTAGGYTPPVPDRQPGARAALRGHARRQAAPRPNDIFAVSVQAEGSTRSSSTRSTSTTAGRSSRRRRSRWGRMNPWVWS